MSSYNYGNINLTTGYSITGPDIDWANSTTQTISIGPYTTSATGATGSTYTIAGSNGTSWNSFSSNPKVNLSRKGLEMDEGCDVTIGAWSLKAAMEKIEQRLAILSPNPKLEAEWEELKELGDRYRELEREITAKMKTWDILKRED
jgi:hypothetical protein